MNLLFWKNKTNVKINPALEDELALVKAQFDLLTFDGQTTPNLDVRVAAGTLKAKNVATTTVNPATEGSLATVRAQTDKFTFDSSSGLKTTGTAPALASSVEVKSASQVTVNPATLEEVQLWKRMVKILESHAVVDASNNQRVSVDFFGSTVTGIGPSGDGVPLVTMASDLVRVIPGISTPTTFMGAGNQYFQDYARNAYARSIRRNLHFT